MTARFAGTPMTWAPSLFNAQEIPPIEIHFYQSRNTLSESRITWIMRILRSVIRTTCENLRFSPFQIKIDKLTPELYN